MTRRRIGVIGGGPAGLMAAEAAAGQGADVVVFEALPTLGRKFLMAGKSGLNITHSEPLEPFLTRYDPAPGPLMAALRAFDGAALRQWCSDLGVETFVGSSGRVFPGAMKGSPLLRSWLNRLVAQGVGLRARHRWIGFEGKALLFDTPQGTRREFFDAIVLALGGASWPKLGSNAAWVPWLRESGVSVAPFRPANCAFDVDWSEYIRERFAGQPVKAVVATSAAGTISGEFVISASGVEGSLVYAHSSALRDELYRAGKAALLLDLAPGRTLERLAADIQRQPGKASFANKMRKGTGLDAVKLGLLREFTPGISDLDAGAIAARIKALPLPLAGVRPLAEAISSAGGVEWESMDGDFMLKALPGVFVAGEMLDWEAPTGGYLLTACFATGKAAGMAASRYAGMIHP